MPYVRRRKVGFSDTKEESGHRSFRSSLYVEVPVYLTLFFAPLAIGTVHVWSTAIVLGIAIASYSALLFWRRKHRMHVKLFPVGIALIGVALLTLIQLVPLPEFLVRILSPGAGDLYDYILTGAGLWGDGNWRTLSLAPSGTALELIKILAYSLVFIVVINYFNDQIRARRLMSAVAWSGFTVALVGLFSKLFMAKAIYGVYPVVPNTFFISTFVNANHLAGFLNLCSLVSFGLALSSRETKFRALYGFMGVIIGTGALMSLSRGGVVAFCLGCLFMIFFCATRRIHRLRYATLTQALAAGVLLVSGYLAYDAIIAELRTLGDVQAVLDEVKIRSWAGMFPMIADHPVVGIGRGAYATVYPRYKSVSYMATFTHAENEAIQCLVEWGPVFGTLLIVAFMLSFLLALSRARRSYSMGGCLSGVFAVSLQSLVDFNLEVGGVALPFVVVLGVLCAGSFAHAGRPRKFETRLRLPRTVAFSLAPLGMLTGVLCVPYVVSHDLETQTRKLLAQKNPAGAEPCSDTPLGRAACEMMNQYPADYMTPLVVGKAYLDGWPRNLVRAAHWLSRAMYLNPTDSGIHRLMGRTLYLAGYRDQAMIEYRLAGRWDASSLTDTAVEVLRLTGDTEAVIRATPVDAKSYLEVSRVFIKQDHPDAAVRAARLALKQDPTLIAALDTLAELSLSARRWNEALGYAGQAIQLDPLHDAAYHLKGRVFFEQGRPKETEKAWLEGLGRAPDSILLSYGLCELYLSQARHHEAVRIANRLQSFAPLDDRSQARLNKLFGRVQEARGMFFAARRSYQMASNLAPENPHYLYLVGLMEERMGNWHEAEHIYQQLKTRRFLVEEMKKRLVAIRKAEKGQRDRAMWYTWIEEEKKEKKEQRREEK